jgi:hypothetical protein
MTLSTLIPAGLVLIAVIVGWFLGLVMGWMAQQGQDRVLRYVAVLKAVKATAAFLGANPDRAAAHIAPPPNLAPWYEQRPAAVARPATTTAAPVTMRPGMPYYREPAKR